MKMEVIGPGIRLQYVPSHDGLRKCVELGHKIADAISRDS
jgi:hypothetical protein